MTHFSSVFFKLCTFLSGYEFQKHFSANAGYSSILSGSDSKETSALLYDSPNEQECGEENVVIPIECTEDDQVSNEIRLVTVCGVGPLSVQCSDDTTMRYNNEAESQLLFESGSSVILDDDIEELVIASKHSMYYEINVMFDGGVIIESAPATDDDNVQLLVPAPPPMHVNRAIPNNGLLVVPPVEFHNYHEEYINAIKSLFMDMSMHQVSCPPKGDTQPSSWSMSPIATPTLHASLVEPPCSASSELSIATDDVMMICPTDETAAGGPSHQEVTGQESADGALRVHNAVEYQIVNWDIEKVASANQYVGCESHSIEVPPQLPIVEINRMMMSEQVSTFPGVMRGRYLNRQPLVPVCPMVQHETICLNLDTGQEECHNAR